MWHEVKSVGDKHPNDVKGTDVIYYGSVACGSLATDSTVDDDSVNTYQT